MATVNIIAPESHTYNPRNPKMGAWTCDDMDKRPTVFEFTIEAEKIGSSPYVIFADNTEDAVFKIRRMINEPTDSAISTVSFSKGWSYKEETDASNITIGNAVIKPDCTIDQVIDYVKNTGATKLPRSHYDYYYQNDSGILNLTKKETQEKLWAAGIHIDMKNGYLLTHDPQKALRQKRQHRTARKVAAVKNSRINISTIISAIEALDIEIQGVEHSSQRKFSCHVNNELYRYRFVGKAWKPKDEFCKLLALSVDYFNFHYGKNAHRKMAEFQDVVARWKVTPERQRAKFGKFFALWMEEEMKARKCKPVKKKDMRQKKNTVTAMIVKKMKQASGEPE